MPTNAKTINCAEFSAKERSVPTKDTKVIQNKFLCTIPTISSTLQIGEVLTNQQLKEP